MAKYSTVDYEKENMARAIGRSLSISTKDSVEICSFVRDRSTTEAKKLLSEVIELERAVPYRVYNKGLAHKRKIGPGKYPAKAAGEVIRVIESAEANAQFKGLNTANLIIKHINAHLAAKQWHYGRKRRRRAKRTHIEIIVQEKKPEKAKEKKAKK